MGFELGPRRSTSSPYDKALAKYLDRVASWGKAGGGLFAIAMAYSVCVASVLCFLVQLDGLPPQWPQVESEVQGRLVLGLSQWMCAQDLKCLD